MYQLSVCCPPMQVGFATENGSLHLQRLQSRTSLQSTQSELGEAHGQDRAGLLPDVDQASLYASWAEAALLCLR